MHASRLLRVGMSLCLVLGLGLWSSMACQPMPPGGEGEKKEAPTTELSITDERTETKGDGESEDSGNEDSGNEDSGSEDSGSEDSGTNDHPPVQDQILEDKKNDDRVPDTSKPDEIIRAAIITPKSFAVIKFPSQTWNLPASAKKDTVLHFALQGHSITVFGGKSGFYRVNAKSISRLNSAPVVGLAAQGTSQVVVAQPKELLLWDGKTLAPTRFTKNLDGSPITALRRQTADSFWIGTEKSLWLFSKGQLQQFKTVKGVKTLVVLASKKLLIIESLQGKFSALQESGGKWLLRAFGTEGVTLKGFVPQISSNLNFWGIDLKNDLWLRKSSGAQAAWWMYRLKPDPDDRETVTIKHMVYQEKTGETWALATNSFYRLSEGISAVLTRPASLAKSILHKGSTGDGALWLSDGIKLVRIGNQSIQVTYKTDIAPIMKQYCTSCHSASGRAKFAPFESYTQVKAKAANIAKRIEGIGGSIMPPKGAMPSHKIGLIKAWIAGGHKP